MLLIYIVRNLFILLKNCLSIINLIKKKKIFYFLLLIFINFFILSNTAYCETDNLESEISIEEQQKKKNSKLVNTICLIIFGIAFLFLWWEFLDFLFGSDDDFNLNDSDSDLSSEELPEVKPKYKPYTQGPGYHFFVRDMGIVYRDDSYPIPEVDVTKTNLYDPKDGPIPKVDAPTSEIITSESDVTEL